MRNLRALSWDDQVLHLNNQTIGKILQVSKLMLAKLQNVSDFDNLRVRKISSSKRLQVRIIHVSQTFGKNLLVILPVYWWKKSY